MIVKQDVFRTIQDFNQNPNFRKRSGNGGVYIWGFSLEKADYTIPTSSKKFFPYYVGKHYHDMHGRTHEHLASLYGGNFPLFDIKKAFNNDTLVGDVLRNYQKYSKKAKPNLGPPLPNKLFPNLIHFPEGVHVMYNYHNSDLIKNQIEWMVKHFSIAYLTPEEATKQEIDIMEKVVGNIIGYEKLITSRFIEIPKYEIVINHSTGKHLLTSMTDLFMDNK